MSSILHILHKIAIYEEIDLKNDTGNWDVPFSRFAMILMNPEYAIGPHYDTLRTVKEKWNLLKMYGTSKNQHMMSFDIEQVRILLTNARLIE